MSQYQVVSRKDLYDDQSSLSVTDEVEQAQIETYKPPAELEIVEIEVPTANSEGLEPTQETEEFDFPLFSFAVDDHKRENAVDKSINETEHDNNGGTKLMRVSLREPNYVVAKQERPKGYYFADYTEDEHQKFAESALEYDTILQNASLGPYKGWTKFRGAVLDVQKYNEKIELALQREKRLKKRKPGQKQRLARRLALEHEKEREEKAKEIKKMIKKKFHKRGGKKNKKKPEMTTPRFRTE